MNDKTIESFMTPAIAELSEVVQDEMKNMIRNQLKQIISDTTEIRYPSEIES